MANPSAAGAGCPAVADLPPGAARGTGHSLEELVRPQGSEAGGAAGAQHLSCLAFRPPLGSGAWRGFSKMGRNPVLGERLQPGCMSNPPSVLEDILWAGRCRFRGWSTGGGGGVRACAPREGTGLLCGAPLLKPFLVPPFPTSITSTTLQASPLPDSSRAFCCVPARENISSPGIHLQEAGDWLPGMPLGSLSS